jgi:MFS family permease
MRELSRPNFCSSLCVAVVDSHLLAQEPIAYTVIFPFVNSQVEFLLPNVPKPKIGAYSGVIEALFALSQFLSFYFWGSLSDRIGRKPVLLAGLFFLAVTMAAYGAASVFWLAVVARSAAGLLVGNGTVLRAVLNEITDPSNEAFALALYSMSL